MKDTSKTKNTPVDSGADNSTSAAYNLSRRQLLAVGPALALAPSMSAMLLSGEANAGAAPADGKIPGYWSPTDPNRSPIDGPKGQDLWRRDD